MENDQIRNTVGVVVTGVDDAVLIAMANEGLRVISIDAHMTANEITPTPRDTMNVMIDALSSLDELERYRKVIVRQEMIDVDFPIYFEKKDHGNPRSIKETRRASRNKPSRKKR